MVKHVMVKVNDNGIIAGRALRNAPAWKAVSKLFYAETSRNREEIVVYWSHDLTNLVGFVGTTSNEVHNIGTIG